MKGLPLNGLLETGIKIQNAKGDNIMAKVSYIISKKSNGGAKGGFHFDGQGNGKWFEKIFKGNQYEMHNEPNEITGLLSKLVVESDYNFTGDKETRIELEGSAEEIKELGQWSVNQIKAEASTLKPMAEFIREYFKTFCDALARTMTTVKWAMRDDDVKETKEEPETQSKKKAAKAKADPATSEEK